MATDKQIAANRANAQKSTGPKTPEGKARASLNGLRHGLLAKSYVLSSENPDAFRAFVESYHREYQPASATELALVDTMATARWRLIRSANIESASLDLEASQLRQPGLDFPTRTVLAHRQAVSVSRSMELVNRAEARLQRQFDSAFDRLRLLRAQRTARQNDRDRLEPPDHYDGTNPIEEGYETGENPNESTT